MASDPLFASLAALVGGDAARPPEPDEPQLQGNEEYLVRKIAEHIGLKTADLVETKLHAREEFIKEEL